MIIFPVHPVILSKSLIWLMSLSAQADKSKGSFVASLKADPAARRLTDGDGQYLERHPQASLEAATPSEDSLRQRQFADDVGEGKTQRHRNQYGQREFQQRVQRDAPDGQGHEDDDWAVNDIGRVGAGGGGL